MQRSMLIIIKYYNLYTLSVQLFTLSTNHILLFGLLLLESNNFNAHNVNYFYANNASKLNPL